MINAQDFREYRKNRNTMLRGRRNEILLPFKFWGEIEPREGNWIYELRTYALQVSVAAYSSYCFESCTICSSEHSSGTLLLLFYSILKYCL